ncbi:MAG: hypothetical protein ABFD66_07865 [Smithella sp.]
MTHPLLQGLGEPLFHYSEDSTSKKQIEGHLPDKTIDTVFDKPVIPGTESIGVRMAYSNSKSSAIFVGTACPGAGRGRRLPQRMYNTPRFLLLAAAISSLI